VRVFTKATSTDMFAVQFNGKTFEIHSIYYDTDNGIRGTIVLYEPIDNIATIQIVANYNHIVHEITLYGCEIIKDSTDGELDKYIYEFMAINIRE